MTAKKATPKKPTKKPAKKSKRKAKSIDLTPNYKGYGGGKEPGMGDITKMAMDGAVLTGSLGLMTTMGGAISAAMPKKT